MAITIKDIAKRTGVSHSTVSRALGGNSLISEATTTRIKKVAREMGYQPSAAARSLKTNQTKVIGVIVNSIDDPFFSEILFGIENEAQQAGYSLFIAASQYDPIREQNIVHTMMEQRTDGVIICSSSFSADKGRQLLANGFPVVVVNSKANENFNYSIYHDVVDGSRQLTRHLLELGHTKIAYLGNSKSGRTSLDRLNGFQTEMVNAGIEIHPDLIYEVQGSEPNLGVESLEYFLGLPDQPTAILCFNDMLAIGLLQACHLKGIKVPYDLSVTGFDNITFSAYTNPPLTTLDQPKYSIGNEAARLLLDLLSHKIESSNSTHKVKILKGRLLVRSSTTTPRVEGKK
ncbi:MAG: LacI family DNA-binding transcriptional regulator [Anaerolineaceae bacterium]|nr:LacI family DNA-binding transcriptional regulator [Anaerolineaceae bacterium]